MRRLALQFLSLLLLVWATTGCTPDLTQLVIVISSDYGTDLHSVGLDIEDENGKLLVSKDFKVIDDGITLPFSFTVEPGSEHKDSVVKITALGIDAQNNILVERTANIGFVDQQRRLLELPLLRACQPINCNNAKQTCDLGLCIENTVDVRSLPVVNPGEEFTIILDKPSGNPDGGVSDGSASGIDSGTTTPSADGGSPDSSITQPDPSCLNVGCPLNQVCVNPGMHTFCDAEASSAGACECRTACDPFGAVLRCGLSTDICTYIEAASPEGQGYCTPDQGGGEQDDFCTGYFNEKEERTGDTCNRTKNFECAGVNANQPQDGRCSRVCRTDLFLNCQFLLSETTYECTNISQDQSSILGTCRLPQQEFNDISSSCFNGRDCASDSCLVPGSRGICTSECGGLETCPLDSTCLTVERNSETQFLCFRECETDRECSNKNLNNVCHPVGDRKICYPRCNLTNFRCPGSEGRCNRVTGHCE